ncbi:TPA: DoxX family protein [Burkholderia vietnamiensis]|uniref:DoxX family protein n=1 Tax=Burkholderia vietnamiensis TaxID=60552 RepID=UPI001B9A80B6|nr:DoxX family protein [Burkholderia vietnamiensis]MBR7907948.1 DoxX family protein [Burkholderia vietnamiensis]HDR9083400.1 DoxX family protein [Burkholderia vietnamiensis]HDR9278122.1 DoxX family protein [Burkholderia vietnamiensis]
MKAAVALALRLVLGAFWSWAGLTKIVGHFDAGPFLTAAVSRSAAAPEAVRLALTGAIVHVALPHVVAVNLIVPWLELAAGLSILLGIATAWGVAGAAAMSVLFLMCGAVGTNPLLLFGAVLLAMSYPYARAWTLHAPRAPATTI